MANLFLEIPDSFWGLFRSRSFVLDRMEDGRYTVTSDTVSSLEDFEKLVLAYDDSVRKDSPYRVLDQEAPMVEHAGYRYPGLVFVRKE